MRLERRETLSDLEKELDRLYGVPLADFVPVRNEIAAELIRVGDDRVAATVGKLRKPSLSAWVVNQLVRTREADVERLLRAGEALERAQRELLAGKSAGFEAARKEDAAAVSVLQQAARQMFPDLSPAMVDRVTQNLRSATSPGRRKELRAGRLTDDLTPAGFELSPDLVLGAPTGKKESAARQKARAEAERLAVEAQELERLANEAELEAKRARQRAEAARRKAATAAAKAQ